MAKRPRKYRPSTSTRTGPLFGAHMSVAGGFQNAFAAAAYSGCDCLQIFVKNQRQWRAPPLVREQIDAYRAAAAESAISPVVAHASYLLNLASPDSVNRKKSIAAMIDELQRCEALGVSALIFHPGAYLDDTVEAGIRRIARSLDEIHKACAGFATRILLETTAGQGTAIGYRFEEISSVIEQTKDAARLGVCLDTCHLFAAGYDFRKADGYAAMIAEMDDTFGTERVECIHTNDSKRELGSRVDRHDHIGKGKIGMAGFTHFVNDPLWRDVPFILETPKGKDGRGTDLDTVNLNRLRGMMHRERA